MSKTQTERFYESNNFTSTQQISKKANDRSKSKKLKPIANAASIKAKLKNIKAPTQTSQASEEDDADGEEDEEVLARSSIDRKKAIQRRAPSLQAGQPIPKLSPRHTQTIKITKTATKQRIDTAPTDLGGVTLPQIDESVNKRKRYIPADI